jgi:hypothetical protein
MLMGIRGFVRDIIGIYIGFSLVQALWLGISNETAFLYGAVILFFSVWFMLERLGIIPKVI